MKRLKTIHMIAVILLIVGGLNWGLVGLFEYNLVGEILGSIMWLERLIYILVGLSAVYELATHRGNCKMCGK